MSCYYKTVKPALEIDGNFNEVILNSWTPVEKPLSEQSQGKKLTILSSLGKVICPFMHQILELLTNLLLRSPHYILGFIFPSQNRKEEASSFLEVNIIESKRLFICVLTPDNIFSKASSISYNVLLMEASSPQLLFEQEQLMHFVINQGFEPYCRFLTIFYNEQVVKQLSSRQEDGKNSQNFLLNCSIAFSNFPLKLYINLLQKVWQFFCSEFKVFIFLDTEMPKVSLGQSGI